MTDLKPCPFCGSQAIVKIANKFSYVACTMCGQRGIGGMSISFLKHKWNTRPIEDKLRTELEKAWEDLDIATKASAEDAEQVYRLRQALEAIEAFSTKFIPYKTAVAHMRSIAREALKGGE